LAQGKKTLGATLSSWVANTLAFADVPTVFLHVMEPAGVYCTAPWIKNLIRATQELKYNSEMMTKIAVEGLKM
jgi:hypothetical protein